MTGRPSPRALRCPHIRGDRRGLTNPMVVRFADDGRVFVSEKDGAIEVFDSLSDSTPTEFANLATNVHNF
ncbi:MAG: hypothetical protein ACR2G9_03590 [Gaiellaceae bacterium]